MKTFRWCLPVLVALCCWSCKQSEAEFTPYIQVSHFYLNPNYNGEEIISADDTLSMYLTSDGVYVLDTIGLKDTVVFQAFYGSYANELVAARVNFDSTEVDMYAKLSKDVQNILLPTSNVKTIQLLVNPGYNGLSFPVAYRPMKSGTFTFNLVCESDSKLSPSSLHFKQPVR